MRARRDGTPHVGRDLSIPTGIDGLIGVQFVEAAAASHADAGNWVVPAFAAVEGRWPDMQRFALIGAGFIGGVHANNLAAHPEVDFAFVYDVDEARAHDDRRQHNASVATTR